MLIRPTALILKQSFFRNLHVVTRLEGLLALKQNNILFGRNYESQRGLLQREYFAEFSNKQSTVFLPLLIISFWKWTIGALHLMKRKFKQGLVV